jgi:hypothetical protein
VAENNAFQSGHMPLHTAFRPSKHPLKSFCCASAYSNRAVCFVNRREQTEGVAGSFVQLYKQSDVFSLFSLFADQNHGKLEHLKKSLEMITRHYVDLTERWFGNRLGRWFFTEYD